MIPFPNKKYNIIYADPPWQYKRNGNHSAESKYNVMSLDAIKDLPVNNIAEDNSHLYMWVTNPFISEGLEVCKSWGFEYKTLLTWVKTYKDGSPIMGMGYYFRGATEHIIFGVKGKKLCQNKNTKNIFFNKQREHSRKPDFVKDMIVKCSGDFSRLELFAREESENWDSWGNDTQKFNKNTIQYKLF
tara:strand:- start:429 stop:989 length:561 start_codon:yes stop_codon:yes gene_type:complete